MRSDDDPSLPRWARAVVVLVASVMLVLTLPAQLLAAAWTRVRRRLRR